MNMFRALLDTAATTATENAGFFGSYGTTIILEIKDNAEEENYDELLEPYRIKSLVKKYSD